jgi:amidohydrolase
MRRDFARHPELSGEEQRTAGVIARRLRDLGLSVETGVGGYGVVGLLRGGHPGPTVAYRADMDALPIQDALETAYRSLELGEKHACGHDAHMAIALGLAELLAARRETWGGALKFIFQPAEESLDGARAMLEAGVLDNPRPEALLMLHVFPIPVGQVGVARGRCLAGMKEFRVRLYSPSGNLELLQSRVAAALREISTGTPPSGPATFAALVRAMQAGGSHTQPVLLSCWPRPGGPSQEDHLLGLVSVPAASIWDAVQAQIRQTLDRVTGAMGATYDLRYTFTNPPLINDTGLVERALPALRRTVGPENVLLFEVPYPFAHEDFALYTTQVPGALLWLGTANPTAGLASLLHTPDFDIDEDALVVGVRVMATVLLHLLRNAKA